MAKISTLSFQKICDTLGTDHFSMHYDCSDALRSVYSENDFEDVKKTLMKQYGDVEVKVNPSGAWFSKVVIINDDWKKDYDEYISAKAEWCSKYGCD